MISRSLIRIFSLVRARTAIARPVITTRTRSAIITARDGTSRITGKT